MMAVIVPTAVAVGGRRRRAEPLLTGERTRRIVTIVLAAMVAGTVLLVWI